MLAFLAKTILLCATVQGASSIPNPTEMLTMESVTKVRSLSGFAPVLQPFVVLEMFTSQGCSSCPPADKVLSKTIATARANDQQVIALAFHVDYWNYLGWDDPFSTAENSARQRWYGNKFGQIYTPQLVVNGATAFVGSDALKTKTIVEQTLKQTPDAGIELGAPRLSSSGRITTQFTLNGSYEGCVMHAALVSKTEQTSVRLGENGGRSLENANVVRVFKSLTGKLPQSGSLVLDIPVGLDPENVQIVAYLQHHKSSRIIGAAATTL
jgi:hypothetical protein